MNKDQPFSNHEENTFTYSFHIISCIIMVSANHGLIF